MDLKQIKQLVKLVEDATISHLSIDEKGVKIEIKKELTAVPTASYVLPAQQVAAAPVAMDATSAPAAAAEKKEDLSGLVPIKAQMVGTFYNAPNPNAKPYVKVGDSVSQGTVICIIEAMKLFNEIESEISGTIEKVCVENGQPVEYGQELFLVRP